MGIFHHARAHTAEGAHALFLVLPGVQRGADFVGGELHDGVAIIFLIAGGDPREEGQGGGIREWRVPFPPARRGCALPRPRGLEHFHQFCSRFVYCIGLGRCQASPKWRGYSCFAFLGQAQFATTSRLHYFFKCSSLNHSPEFRIVRPIISRIRAVAGREWLRNDTFPPGKAGRSATVPALQSNPKQEQ